MTYRSSSTFVIMDIFFQELLPLNRSFLYAARGGRILSSSSPSVRPYVYSCERNSS